MSTSSDNLFTLRGLRKNLDKGHLYHYLAALTITLSVMYIKRLYPDLLGSATPFLLLPTAILLSAYVGGFGPGVFSTFIGTGLVVYFFLLDRLFSSSAQLVMMVATSIFIIEGIVISYFVSLQDRIIHKTKELESKKDDFMNATSHELKTPLTSMKMYTGILRKQLEQEGGRHLDKLEKIDSQVQRFNVLVDQLLDITRLNARRTIFNKRPFDLNSCVHEIVEAQQQLHPTHTFIINNQTNRMVYVDGDRLGQVITNLITNAVKYSPRGGQIIVTMKQSADMKGFAEISVQDFGIGIDKKFYKHIFERFYRVNSTDEQTYPGLGIGLFLSSEIVKNHGGRIWVTSEKGKGSTFYFTVPFA